MRATKIALEGLDANLKRDFGLFLKIAKPILVRGESPSLRDSVEAAMFEPLYGRRKSGYWSLPTTSWYASRWWSTLMNTGSRASDANCIDMSIREISERWVLLSVSTYSGDGYLCLGWDGIHEWITGRPPTGEIFSRLYYRIPPGGQ